ncbi:hypothetical protein Ahia01_001031300 [Argonauta hians]
MFWICCGKHGKAKTYGTYIKKHEGTYLNSSANANTEPLKEENVKDNTAKDILKNTPTSNSEDTSQNTVTDFWEGTLSEKTMTSLEDESTSITTLSSVAAHSNRRRSRKKSNDKVTPANINQQSEQVQLVKLNSSVGIRQTEFFSDMILSKSEPNASDVRIIRARTSGFQSSPTERSGCFSLHCCNCEQKESKKRLKSCPKMSQYQGRKTRDIYLMVTPSDSTPDTKSSLQNVSPKDIANAMTKHKTIPT